ncbi:hypothetical protein F751_0763 [Auxenochlorella protothecoides]|uniref:Uncharacterized protein n=1 Tax=Auxenochlorella protothecoides TaxID=3075 RepID=A0A087SM77_AUXPR|nr:hypothetical protein F751_0763 [Auxenochlorella protothecoides]KFM26831.1 hypothetical protein F751_0763 [Auxenochlorella protothecoides]
MSVASEDPPTSGGPENTQRPTNQPRRGRMSPGPPQARTSAAPPARPCTSRAAA